MGGGCGAAVSGMSLRLVVLAAGHMEQEPLAVGNLATTGTAIEDAARGRLARAGRGEQENR